MNTTPFHYQVQGYRQLERFGGRCLIAWEMGTGKSLLSLLYAYNNPDLRPLVIVCPASLKWNWEAECYKHFNWRAEVLEGTKPPRKSLWNKHKVVIVNYDILGERRGGHTGKGWMTYLTSLGPKLIILDESHYVSNRAALRTRWVRELCQGVDHILALTGTPLSNRPADLWTTLNILRPDLYPNFYSYGHKFCSPRRHFWGWDFKGASNLGLLNRRLKRSLMLRKTEAEVLSDLPNKIRSVVPLKLAFREDYDEAEENFAGWLDKYQPEKKDKALKAEAITKMGYLLRLAAQLKLRQVIEWITTFLESSDGKLLVFGIHKKILQGLAEEFVGLSVRLDGSTPVKLRKDVVRQFQGDKRIRLFLGNIDAAGKGLNLTAASTVAFAEIAWVPGLHTQAEDRAHRIGTKNCVNVYYLVAKDTIEIPMVKIIQNKQKVIKEALDGDSKGDKLDVYDQIIKVLRQGRKQRV